MKMTNSLFLVFILASCIAVVSAPPAFAQQSLSVTSPAADAAAAPVQITLEEAIKRAEANEPGFAAVSAESKSAGLDRWMARAGVMPSVSYYNQAIYTQMNRDQTVARFINNNAPREYISQAVINETVGLDSLAGVRRVDAASALAAAKLEIARRGLVAAVTALYYDAAAADSKLGVAERARGEATDFTALTSKREQAREAAHADVVKAQLQQQERERNFSDARVAAEKARLELGVLLFSDPRTPYSLVPETGVAPLATRTEAEASAARNNPELKGALFALKMSNDDVLAARAAYLPDLGLNVTYGIDAQQFATYGPDHLHNLGYSASVTLDIPVWNWLSTQHKIKQSEIRRDAERVALSATQRQLIAHLNEAYSEAEVARSQLTSLEESVATAAESLRLTKLRYTEGEATVLEVVDAQTAFVAAENAHEDGQVRYQMARANLQTLTGTM